MRRFKNSPGRLGLILLAFLATLVVQGCGSKPTRIEAEVVAAPDVNRDVSGRALPIVVRLYELKTTGSFESADFFSLYDREGETLGGDLLAREELDLHPGQRGRVERTAAPDAQYIGVIGAYRNIDQARWRTTYPLQAGKTNKVLVNVGPDAISIR